MHVYIRSICDHELCLSEQTPCIDSLWWCVENLHEQYMDDEDPLNELPCSIQAGFEWVWLLPAYTGFGMNLTALALCFHIQLHMHMHMHTHMDMCTHVKR